MCFGSRVIAKEGPLSQAARLGAQEVPITALAGLNPVKQHRVGHPIRPLGRICKDARHRRTCATSSVMKKKPGEPPLADSSGVASAWMTSAAAGGGTGGC